MAYTKPTETKRGMSRSITYLPTAVMSDDPFDHRVDAKDQWQGRGKCLVWMVTKDAF
jgi:hypothetical protein